jgi:hypothetical protein
MQNKDNLIFLYLKMKPIEDEPSTPILLQLIFIFTYLRLTNKF